MALVKCKECGYEITKSTKLCPGCGGKVNRSPSPMVLWILVALVIIVLISAGYSIRWLMVK